MVLDREQDETVRVFLENWLLELFRAEIRNGGWFLWCLGDLLCGGVLGIEVLGQGGDSRVLEVIFLVGDAEVKLLYWRLHLEGFNARSSL